MKITITNITLRNRENSTAHKTCFRWLEFKMLCICKCILISLTPISISNFEQKSDQKSIHIIVPRKLIKQTIKSKMKEDILENRLIKAMRDKDYIKARKLIIDSEVDINYRDKNGNSPLHIACLNGSQNMIEWLLDKEASMSIQNRQGNTPLHILVMKGYSDIISEVSFLYQKKTKSAANIQNGEGNTALDVVYMSESYFFTNMYEDLASIGANTSEELRFFSHYYKSIKLK